MKRLAPWVLALAVLAGCAKNTARPSAKMNAPQGVAIFRGYGADQPGVLRPLVAVANTNGDDLRIIDAVTSKVLAGPTQVAALSVPTEPRPVFIAAGSLHDRTASGNELALPDLLLVAPRSQVERPLPAPPGTFGAVIQRIVTWDDRTRVDPAVRTTAAGGNTIDVGGTIDLGGLLPDATLTALLVVPVPEPDGAGGWRPMAGRARVVASTTDGALVSIEASRDPASASGAILLGDPVVQLLGFVGLDLAVSADGTRLYAASLDPIPGAGGVLGVAEFDNTPVTAPAFARPLSARLGTTRVAATDVLPFVDNDPAVPELDKFGAAAEPRVYAVLDPSACGRDRSMPCGIAVIDPALGGLAADPAGELPYQLPIQVPGEVVDIAVSGPPAVTDSSKAGFLKFDPGSGLRWTQSIAAVTTTTGRVILVDLSHFSVGNVFSPLLGTNSTRVYNSASYSPSKDTPVIGTWWEPVSIDGTPPPPPSIQFDATALFGIAVTPGYTNSETFRATFQGKLPGLDSRLAVAHVDAGPPSWVAIQEDTGFTGPGQSRWRSVARLYDPRLAVQIGDLIVVEGFSSAVQDACAAGPFELEVTGFLRPDPVLYPGGAVAVKVRDPAVQPKGANPSCLPPGDSVVKVSFRTPGMVLTGTVSGYAGRPGFVLDSPETAPRFEFKYEDEQALPCPIMPDDPQAWPPPAAAMAACEADVAGCRATCERLVLSRRARRSYYMTDGCPPVTSTTQDRCRLRWVKMFHLAFPMPRGPAVAFKLGLSDVNALPSRDAFLVFSTGSGLVAGSRAPSLGTAGSGAVAPYGVTLFDKSAYTRVANDGIYGYAAFSDNLVLGFAPWSNVAPATTIR